MVQCGINKTKQVLVDGLDFTFLKISTIAKPILIHLSQYSH